MTSEKNNFPLSVQSFEANYRLILASKSPRRQEMIRQLGLTFELRTKDTDETIPEGMPPHEVPVYLARIKADAFRGEIQPGEVVLTADTIVLCNQTILNKADNYEQAYEMLSMLSGNMHEVITGIGLTSTEKQVTDSDITRVYFRKLAPEEIDYYITRCKPFDKAGAYGIQEWIGMTAIERIEGSYFNVVGLPIHKVYHLLTNF